LAPAIGSQPRAAATQTHSFIASAMALHGSTGSYFECRRLCPPSHTRLQPAALDAVKTRNETAVNERDRAGPRRSETAAQKANCLVDRQFRFLAAPQQLGRRCVFMASTPFDPQVASHRFASSSSDFRMTGWPDSPVSSGEGLWRPASWRVGFAAMAWWWRRSR
jgi:hypothetical protein